MQDNTLLPGSVLALSAAAAQRLVEAGNGDAALLYLQLLRSGQQDIWSAARSALKWDIPQLKGALETLVKLGLLQEAAAGPASPAPPEPDAPPEYTAADISRELETQTSYFPGLVQEVQRRLGKVLSTADLKTLYTLYDYLGLPPEVILLLVRWCSEEYERKYGPGRFPRLSSISRQGFAWKRRGIDTVEAAEDFLCRQARLRSSEGRLLALVGVTGRAATTQEQPYLEGWLEMGFSDEAIRLAYEKTLFQKQNMNWNYMNSILKSWHQKGLHTPEEIAAGDTKRMPPSPQRSRPSSVPGEAERRVREDLERMRAFMRQQKESEGGKDDGV